MTLTLDPRQRKQPKPAPARGRRLRRTSAILAAGEPMVWLTGGALATCLLMIALLLGVIGSYGLSTFWPKPVTRLALANSATWMGEYEREEHYEPVESVRRGFTPEQERHIDSATGLGRRRMFRIGNYEFTGEHYKWFNDVDVQEETYPEWALVVERTQHGRFYGELVGFALDGSIVDGAIANGSPDAAWKAFERDHAAALDRADQVLELRTHDIGDINAEEEALRLALKRIELDSGADSAAYRDAERESALRRTALARHYEEIQGRIAALEKENSKRALVLRSADGAEHRLPLDTIVRAHAPNRIGVTEQIGVYLSRWSEFLTARPRESNSEGGAFPAIFGTVVMTLLMSVLVVPLGVLAALYLREYAKPGLAVRCVRIAVNNLAGVPSIVYGVFGLGFFCYVIGSSIDGLLFAEKLPNPTFGKGGLLWAALTLALLTMPVVIVATEEALASVPNSMREGSYACGATKWQTIQRIVLPRALPGIMTGMILAIARGAGEVAPLMLVGAINLAEDLPVDGTAPYVHAERSFMHLGFNIYNLGFQAQNSEAAKPMVYTTTLLLMLIILVLNVTAIWMRARLRHRYLSTPI